MASSTDLKKLFEKYQEEGAPRGVSIVKYCQMNGVVYFRLEKWYEYLFAGVLRSVDIVGKDGLISSSKLSLRGMSFYCQYIPC